MTDLLRDLVYALCCRQCWLDALLIASLLLLGTALT
jgi:hypothetical protein